MKNSFHFFFRFTCFWMLYFFVFRTLFYLLEFSHPVNGEKLHSYPSVIFHSLRLDLSVTGYVFAIPLLLYLIQLFASSKFWQKIVNGYTVVILTVFTAVQSANILLYPAWGTIINYRALAFLSDPAEMLASLTTFELIISIGTISLVVYLFYLIFLKAVSPFFVAESAKKYTSSISVFLLAAATVLMIRGGWQLIPVNESSAYFSSNTKLNHMAINPVWYLGHNVNQSLKADKNSFHFYDTKFALECVRSIYKSDTTNNSPSILKTSRPNIVFIMLESYTADIIQSLGGDKGTAPEFEKLAKEGLLFTHIYSSGFRTDQAFVSVLSGFPAQPDKSIIRYPEKTRQLPSLPADLKKQGYYTSFYYGGELAFSNLYSYLVNCGFHKTIGKTDFPSQQYNSKWGAHDEYVLAKQMADLSSMKQPFFSVLMTLTSHEPFEAPIATPFTQNDLPSRFRNAAWYTDKCLGDYMRKAKMQPWYSNTIIVIVADHGHVLPMQRNYYEPASRHIPLLITGGALKEEWKNMKSVVTGNQNDIASTLLNQLNLNSNAFEWSNNLLNPHRNNFAYLCMDDAIGWVTDSCEFVYQVKQSTVTHRQPQNCVADTLTAKSYLQKLYGKFMAF